MHKPESQNALFTIKGLHCTLMKHIITLIEVVVAAIWYLC